MPLSYLPCDGVVDLAHGELGVSHASHHHGADLVTGGNLVIHLEGGNERQVGVLIKKEGTERNEKMNPADD
jgi:hypothetical protein